MWLVSLLIPPALLAWLILPARRRRTELAASLVTPTYIESLISTHHDATRVRSACVTEIAHCGDGKASTTDRVHVTIEYAENGHALPARALLKVILLPHWLRIGGIDWLLQLGAAAADVLRPVGLDGLIYLCLNWYNYYLPHAPDAMYENEARVYRHVLPELSSVVETPRVLGTGLELQRRRSGVLMEDVSLRPGAHFPAALIAC